MKTLAILNAFSPAVLATVVAVILCQRASAQQATLMVTEKITLDPVASTSDKGVVFKGISSNGGIPPSPGTIPATGPGIRMMWYPGKAALRVGGVSLFEGATSWDDSVIGAYSIATGFNAKASGPSSVAMGRGVVAAGWYGPCVAMGEGAVASGGAAGNVALGYYTTASGMVGSTALGANTTASNQYATALGHQNTASGLGALATGGYNLASGDYATSLGYSTTARSYGVTVIGRFNALETSFNPTSWVDSDPLFIVGNGTGNPLNTIPATVRNRNALTVYKNGNATFQGVVRVAPGGDIPMFTN